MDPVCERELLSLCRDLEDVLAAAPSASTAVRGEPLTQEISKFYCTLGGPMTLDELRPLCRDFLQQFRLFFAAAKGRVSGLGEVLEASLQTTLTHLCALVIRMIEGLSAGMDREEAAHLAAAAAEYVVKASQASTDFRVQFMQNFVVSQLLSQIRLMQSANEDLQSESTTAETQQAEAQVAGHIQHWRGVATSWLPSSGLVHHIDEAEAVIKECERAADEVDFLVARVLTLGAGDVIEEAGE